MIRGEDGEDQELLPHWRDHARGGDEGVEVVGHVPGGHRQQEFLHRKLKSSGAAGAAAAAAGEFQGGGSLEAVPRVDGNSIAREGV